MPKAPKQVNEEELWSEGYSVIAGVDEVGRGALMGPLVAAACVFRPKQRVYKVRDSKQLNSKKREELAKNIKRSALCYAYGVVELEEINQLNIHQANQLALMRAVQNLKTVPDYVLVDGYRIKELTIKQKHIIKGDRESYTIAAASILAKTYRDALVVKLARQYPGWGFERNMGYGTAEHLKKLKELGPLPVHRKLFAPVCRVSLFGD